MRNLSPIIYLKIAFKSNEKLKSYNISKNRSNIEIKDEILVNYLTEVGLQVKNRSEKLGIFEKYYPKLKKKIQCNDIKFTYSENPITDKGYPLRDWHLDLGNKIVTGLWYFKNVKEEDGGGHLIFGNPHTGEEVTFDYQAQTKLFCFQIHQTVGIKSLIENQLNILEDLFV